MIKLLAIAIGGACGSVLRYLLYSGIHRFTGDWFPVGTFAVNVLGCLAIGMAAGYFAGPQFFREEVRLALVVGLLGGFTTFSAFGLELFHLVNDGAYIAASLYMIASCVTGLAAVWAGFRLAQVLLST